ncbi:hypothetical protein GCM10027091_60010 [Streptomyces daliensis]
MSFFSARRRKRGLAIREPSERTAKADKPRSIPASASAWGRMSGSVSTTKLRKYRPALSLVTVTEVGVAGSRRDHLILRSPTLATYTLPFSWREKALALRRMDCRVSFFDL